MSMRNIGVELVGRTGFNYLQVTAGAGEDGAWQEGVILDTQALPGHPLSAKAIFALLLTLTADKTATVEARVYHGDDSGLSDGAALTGPGGAAQALATTLVGTGALTASEAQASFDVNLSSAKRYIRLDFKVTLSATGTDTCDVTGVWAFGGLTTQPAE